jgi:hypothetical protein
MASGLEEEEDLVFDEERNSIGRPQGLLPPVGTKRNGVGPLRLYFLVVTTPWTRTLFTPIGINGYRSINMCEVPERAH